MSLGTFGSVPSGLGRGTSVAKLLSSCDSLGSSSAGIGGKFCGSGDCTDGCIGGGGCLGVLGTPIGFQALFHERKAYYQGLVLLRVIYDQHVHISLYAHLDKIIKWTWSFQNFSNYS